MQGDISYDNKVNNLDKFFPISSEEGSLLATFSLNSINKRFNSSSIGFNFVDNSGLIISYFSIKYSE